jgi:hypothetical protein
MYNNKQEQELYIISSVAYGTVSSFHICARIFERIEPQEEKETKLYGNAVLSACCGMVFWGTLLPFFLLNGVLKQVGALNEQVVRKIENAQSATGPYSGVV